MSFLGMDRSTPAPPPPTRDSAAVAREALEERRRRASAVGRAETIYAGRSFLGGNPASAGPAGSVSTPTLGGRSYLGG